jgi:molybdate transport system ATP-binding protein
VLAVNIEHRLGDFALDIDFRVGGGLTALFGRSGAGKTSAINAIAGLLHPRRGRILLDGSVLLDTDRGICVPAHKRRVGYVFQEGRLFPHLTVKQNLTFGKGGPPALTMSSTCSASRGCSTAGRAGCRAARSSASRSAARCWQTRGCC